MAGVGSFFSTIGLATGVTLTGWLGPVIFCRAGGGGATFLGGEGATSSTLGGLDKRGALGAAEEGLGVGLVGLVSRAVFTCDNK